jgi:hypothetical protein
MMDSRVALNFTGAVTFVVALLGDSQLWAKRL